MNKDEKELIIMAKLTIAAAMAALGALAAGGTPANNVKEDAAISALQDHVTKLQSDDDDQQANFKAFLDAYNANQSSGSGASSSSGSSSAAGSSSTSGASTGTAPGSTGQSS